MFMPGHRNEGFIRSYNRNMSSDHKRSISTALSTLNSSTISKNPSIPQSVPMAENVKDDPDGNVQNETALSLNTPPASLPLQREIKR